MQFNAKPISTKILTAFALFLVYQIFPLTGKAQVVVDDSSKTVVTPVDTVKADTLTVSTKEELKSKVHYTADDSIRFEVDNEKVFLYGNARVTYEDIQLDAAYMEVNWETQTLYAKSGLDSAGNDIGLPVFQQKEEKFTAKAITYNFETKKGKISQVITKQGEGYVHGETIKKIDDENYFIRKGAYTTCDLPHPHYSIASNKLKVIKDDKIITGPAYLIIEDVPTPLAIPFGYFPTRKGRASGILIPSYGESGELGFFLKDGGYYFGLGDVVDFAITGDIYSLGSWGLQLNSNYANRYHYNGSLALKYSEIKISEKELPDYELNKDFFVHWNHRQDTKARPNSVFSAEVNAGTSDYYDKNISSANNYLTNTFQSSISWQKSWQGKPYHFQASLSHNQNTNTHDLNLSLPVTSFGVDKFHPLKKEKAVGTEKWYEKIGISYSNNFQNTLNTVDSLLFTSQTADQFRYGMSHNIPISTSMKALKYFTLSPQFNYHENWYMSTIRQNYADTNIVGLDTVYNAILVDTVYGFRAARDFDVSASLSTRLYGMVQMKKGKIAAIRHVLTPSLSYSYRPDFSNDNFNAYKKVQIDTLGNTEDYSIYQNSVYGGPPSGKYGMITLNLDNNLEMKTRSVTDTAVNLKKVKIFESLAGNVGYNTAVDSLNWTHINLSARTTLFDKLNLNVASNFDPYVIDTNGRNINKSELKANNRLARLVTSNFTVGYSITGKKNNKPKESNQGTEEELEHINENIDDYVDFSIPFNLSINYNLSFAAKSPINEETFNQTLNFNGDVSVTPKWKITFNSGYDFRAKDLSYTRLGIYRDLHCWEMHIEWVPFGPQEYYNFQINIKSSILKDLKLTKKNDIYD